MAIATLSALPVRAATSAAVLMVEDEGWGPRQPLTERLGLQLYGELLASGSYKELIRIKGRQDANQRLAKAIVELASRNDHVDVWLSVHTTTRDPYEMQRLIPAHARKLRLVYSTACHGDQEERKAWEVLRPKTVITHMGINNPLFTLPYVVSRWMAGDAIGPAVATGWRETQLGMRFALAMPGVDASCFPDVCGSKPVISGDQNLTIMSGIGPARPGFPEALRWSPRTGGSLGLALRTLARSGFEVHGHEVRGLVDTIVLPKALPTEAIDRLTSIKVTRPNQGRLELELGQKTEIPMQGITLVLNPLVELWPGTFDTGRRDLQVKVSGVWARKGILRAKISSLTLTPDKGEQGYRVKAGLGVFGFIPWRYSFSIGGQKPAPFAFEPAIFRALDPALPVREATGAAGALAALVERR